MGAHHYSGYDERLEQYQPELHNLHIWYLVITISLTVIAFTLYVLACTKGNFRVCEMPAFWLKSMDMITDCFFARRMWYEYKISEYLLRKIIYSCE